MKKTILIIILAIVITLSIPVILLMGFGFVVGMSQLEKNRAAAPLIKERHQQILKEREFWSIPFSPFSQVKKYYENTWLAEYRDSPDPYDNSINYFGIITINNIFTRCYATTFFDKPDEWLSVSYTFNIDAHIQNSASDAQMNFIKSFLTDSLEQIIPNTNQRQQISDWLSKQLVLPDNNERSIHIVDNMKISMRHNNSAVKRDDYDPRNSHDYHIIVSLEIKHKG